MMLNLISSLPSVNIYFATELKILTNMVQQTNEVKATAMKMY